MLRHATPPSRGVCVCARAHVRAWAQVTYGHDLGELLSLLPMAPPNNILPHQPPTPNQPWRTWLEFLSKAYLCARYPRRHGPPETCSLVEAEGARDFAQEVIDWVAPLMEEECKLAGLKAFEQESSNQDQIRTLCEATRSPASDDAPDACSLVLPATSEQFAVPTKPTIPEEISREQQERMRQYEMKQQKLMQDLLVEQQALLIKSQKMIERQQLQHAHQQYQMYCPHQPAIYRQQQQHPGMPKMKRPPFSIPSADLNVPPAPVTPPEVMPLSHAASCPSLFFA